MANHGMRIGGGTAAVMFLGPIFLGGFFWMFHNHRTMLGIGILALIAFIVKACRDADRHERNRVKAVIEMKRRKS